MEEIQNTQAEAVNTAEPKTEEPKPEAAPVAEEPKAPEPEKPKATLAETISPAKPKPESVPIDVALRWKKEAKEARQALEDSKAEAAKAQPTTPKRADEIADEMARKYSLDPQFARELLSSVSQVSAEEAERRARDAYESELAPVREMREREQQAEARRRFDAALEESLSGRPEVAAIANRDALYRLAADPSFAEKTMDDLVEYVYGKPVAQRPAVETVEAARPSRQPDEIDFSKVAGDPALMASVMSDPAQRAKYNAYQLELLKRI